ncbi:MAG: PH domain-containing protein [Cyclobacteriaceae bacterium]|nr:PH domain-containing protein [Cyclobacteriaceae bacterium]MCH8514799.1 PH domain-containing protein [Cyclobacteriaceae bacterium]
MEEIDNNFENAQVLSDSIPSFEGIPTEPIEKDYLKILLIQLFFELLIIHGAWFIVYQIDNAFAMKWGLIALAVLVPIILIRVVITIAVFPTRKYLLRDQDISYEQGKIFYAMTTVPVNRIQHVSLGQGPLEGLFKLAHINVYTAGGVQADLHLPGLKKQKAEDLKEYLLHKVKDLKVADQQQTERESPLDKNEGLSSDQAISL